MSCTVCIRNHGAEPRTPRALAAPGCPGHCGEEEKQIAAREAAYLRTGGAPVAYFPLFVELEGQPVLIIGGGKKALDKARKLLDYGPDITVIAPEICPELAELPQVRTVRRAFRPGDIRDSYIFVIAAADDNAVNREAAALCRERRIPVNAVDIQEECSFIFPSLVHRGPLSIGISTGGASPTAAVHIKNGIDRALPDSTEDILLWLRSLRGYMRGHTQTEEQRKGLWKILLNEALRLDRPLTEEETERLLSGVPGGAEKDFEEQKTIAGGNGHE